MERGWRRADAGGLDRALHRHRPRLDARRPGLRRSVRHAPQPAHHRRAAVRSPAPLIIALTPGRASRARCSTVGATALLGLGIGAYFPLALTLPVDVASDAADAASISALMLLIGYLLAAIAPVVLGLVRDATGDFEP